jgi:hypothetical protein
MRTSINGVDGVLPYGGAPLFFCEKQSAQSIYSASAPVGAAVLWCNDTEKTKLLLRKFY